MPEIMQGSFTGGELSPSLYSRVDLARWGLSLMMCKDWIVQPYGGVKNRPGTYFIEEVKDSSKRVRLLPFRFNVNETYVLEVGDGYTRIYRGGEAVYVKVADLAFYSGTTTYGLGALVKSFGVPYKSLKSFNLGNVPASSPTWWKALDTVTIGVDAYVRYEIATPYTESSLRDIRFAQSADVMTLAHQDYQVSNLNRYADANWTYTPVPLATGPWLELNLDESVSMTCSTATGTATLTATADIFNAAEHEGRLVYIEQATYGKPWESGKAVAAGEIRRSDGKYYQALNAATTGTLFPTHYTGTWYDGEAGVNWLYLHSGYGVARINTVTDAQHCGVTILQRMPSELSASGTGFGAAVDLTGATYGYNSDNFTVITKAGHGITLTGPARVTLAGGNTDPSGSNTFTVNITAVDTNTITTDFIYATYSGSDYPFQYGFEQYILAAGGFSQIEPPASNKVSSTRWKFSSWGGVTRKWPGLVSYYQGRRAFAATVYEPQTLWLSRTNAYNDFSVSVPLQDDDALNIPMPSPQLNSIAGLVDVGKLAVLTQGAEWILGTGQDDVVTPDNAIPKFQGAHGSQGVEPLQVVDTALFVQRKGQVIRDLEFNLAKDKYEGTDLTTFASHLVVGRQVVEWCYQQHPFGIVWLVMSDGALLGITYMREQQVVGWHRHDVGGEVESICCVGEGDEDAVYMAVKRMINGTTKRYIERLHSREVVNVARDSFFVDCGLSYDGTSKINVLVVGDDFTAATITISGGTAWDETELLTATCSASLFSGSSDINDGIFFVDGLTVYRFVISEYVSGTVVKGFVDKTLPAGYRGVARTDWQLARDTFTIAHLKGETVSVLSDGNYKGTYTVDPTTGKVTIDSPGVLVHIGLPITADIKTLEIAQTGNPNQTLATRRKAINEVKAQVLESRGLKAGRDFDHLFEHKERSTEGYDQPVRLQDGLVEISISTPWATDGSICIRQDLPLPVTITSLIPSVEVGGV